MKRILVVDDEDDVRLFLQDFLAEHDLEVEAACDGKEALKKVEEWQPHIVLLDVMMPVMDGMECLKHIKSKFPETIVIMITALKDEARILAAKKLGANDYIIKPFSLTYLEEELGKLLQ